MSSARSTIWLNRFAWLTCIATLLLICSGGMVTSKGVGLAVPDWPTTFGYNMFLFPVSKWVGGIFFEHTHRLTGSIVGLLTCILALWLHGISARRFMRWCGPIIAILGFTASLVSDRGRGGNALVALGFIMFVASFVWPRSQPVTRWIRNLGIVAVGAVILQGILGGLRVTMLKDEIGIFHACLAQAFLALLVLIALVTTKFWQKIEEGDHAKLAPIKSISVFATVLIYLQLALGATMRHQHRDLAILDFPTAYQQWIPDTSASAIAKINAGRDTQALSDVNAFQIWLQMAHRFLAAIIAVAVITLCLRVWKDARQIAALRRLSSWWVVLLLGQVTLGAWTIWSNKAADIATAHVAIGATMLSFGVSICAILWRILRSEPIKKGVFLT